MERGQFPAQIEVKKTNVETQTSATFSFEMRSGSLDKSAVELLFLKLGRPSSPTRRTNANAGRGKHETEKRKSSSLSSSSSSRKRGRDRGRARYTHY